MADQTRAPSEAEARELADLRIEGSIYEGYEAALATPALGTVAQVRRYKDAVLIAQALATLPQQDRSVDARWRRVSDTPKVGATYVVGGYVARGGLPRGFERTFATCVLLEDGPSWSHREESKSYIPIEWWFDTGPHPEHPAALSRSQDSSELAAKLRSVISHATGGGTDDIDLGLNEICVRITRHVNRAYQAGQDHAALGSQHRSAPDDLRTTLEWIAGHDAAANGLDGFAFELVESLTSRAREALASRSAPDGWVLPPELVELSEKATAGPWQHTTYMSGTQNIEYPGHRGVAFADQVLDAEARQVCFESDAQPVPFINVAHRPEDRGKDSDPQRWTNAEFITELVNWFRQALAAAPSAPPEEPGV